jgi:hypothetical protein
MNETITPPGIVIQHNESNALGSCEGDPSACNNIDDDIITAMTPSGSNRPKTP